MNLYKQFVRSVSCIAKTSLNLIKLKVVSFTITTTDFQNG